MKFLILGCGSMGKRRARCLRRLGFENIIAQDIRSDRRDEIAAQSGVQTVDSFDQGLAASPDIVLICLPPHRHLEALTACIRAGIPAFCESPMTMTVQEADQVIAEAESRGVMLAPSCTYLFNQIHQTIQQFLDENKFGRPLAALSYVGQHVADWHPYEDYRAFYASKRAEGGMCFDMLPHDLHLFSEFFGDVRGLSCMARRRSTDIETDPGACDVYDVLLDMASGVSLTLHQDMFQRPWGNYRKIICERGAIEWNWKTLRACEYAGPQFLKEPVWQEIPLPDYEFEAMYVNEIDHAIQAITGRQTYRMPPRRERSVLQWVLACEESSNSGRHIVWPGA